MAKRMMQDYDFALELRDIVKKLVAEEVQRIRPRYRYAEVQSVNLATRKATVIFTSEVTPVEVNIGGFTYILPNDIVRIEGIGTDKFVADVIGGKNTVATVSNLSMGGLPAFVIGFGSGAVNGEVRIDNNVATPTYVRISNVSADGVDMTRLVESIAVGDVICIMKSGQRARYRVTSSDNYSYYMRYGVKLVDQNLSAVNGDIATFTVSRNPDAWLPGDTDWTNLVLDSGFVKRADSVAPQVRIRGGVLMFRGAVQRSSGSFAAGATYLIASNVPSVIPTPSRTLVTQAAFGGAISSGRCWYDSNRTISCSSAEAGSYIDLSGVDVRFE